MALGQEATIVINGVKLSPAEAMTVRVALGSFAISLTEGLGDDDTGKSICAGYNKCVSSINRIIRVV